MKMLLLYQITFSERTYFVHLFVFVKFLYCDSGESMENALRACCKGIKIGKILIHREGDNGQQVCFLSPSCSTCVFDVACFCFLVFLFLSRFLINKQLIYEKLPNDISDRHVLLLDPILGTGSFVIIVKTLSYQAYYLFLGHYMGSCTPAHMNFLTM